MNVWAALTASTSVLANVAELGFTDRRCRPLRRRRPPDRPHRRWRSLLPDPPVSRCRSHRRCRRCRSRRRAGRAAGTAGAAVLHAGRAAGAAVHACTDRARRAAAARATAAGAAALTRRAACAAGIIARQRHDRQSHPASGRRTPQPRTRTPPNVQSKIKQPLAHQAPPGARSAATGGPSRRGLRVETCRRNDADRPLRRSAFPSVLRHAARP